MSSPLRIAALAFLLLAPAPAVLAGDETFEGVRAEARADLVDRLLELATWCNTNQLFEERDRLWRTVIGIEPDNLEARKGLRYARNVDGSWKEPSPRPAKNMNAAALAMLPARRSQAVKPYSDALLERMKGEDVTPDLRRSVLEEILAVDPEDEGAHLQLGEKRLDDRWVIEETVTAKTRRAAIRESVQAAKDAPPGILPSPATDEDKQSFDRWKCGAATADVRVLGTGDAATCERLANACRVTGTVFESLLGAPPRWAQGFCFYLVAGAGEKDAFLATQPDLDDAGREALKRTIGGGIPGTWKVVLFEVDEKKQLDCAVRHAIAHLLLQGWNVQPAHAWIFEGLGLYLTREICGTRLTWFSSGSGAKTEGKGSPRGKLLAADTNWMNEAYKLLSREKPVDLATVLGRDLTTMGVEDVLVSYALAAYLVEGRPDAISPLLKAVGEGAAPADAIQGALGLSVSDLQARLARWLSERK